MYVIICEKAFLAAFSIFNNLCYAKAGVNETGLYYRSLLGLQNPTFECFNLYQNNSKCSQKYDSIWPTGIWHDNEILLTINEQSKGMSLYSFIVSIAYTSLVYNIPCDREIIIYLGPPLEHVVTRNHPVLIILHVLPRPGVISKCPPNINL